MHSNDGNVNEHNTISFTGDGYDDDGDDGAGMCRLYLPARNYEIEKTIFYSHFWIEMCGKSERERRNERKTQNDKHFRAPSTQRIYILAVP